MQLVHIEMSRRCRAGLAQGFGAKIFVPENVSFFIEENGTVQYPIRIAVRAVAASPRTIVDRIGPSLGQSPRQQNDEEDVVLIP